MSNWDINFDSIDDNLKKLDETEKKTEVLADSSFANLTLEEQKEREAIKRLFDSGKFLFREDVTPDGEPMAGIYIGEEMETPIQVLAEFSDEDIPLMDEKTKRDYMVFKKYAIEYEPVDLEKDLFEIDSLFD